MPGRFEIRIRDCARDDLLVLPANIRERIVRAIENRLIVAPERYGTRLRKSLTGLWKLRVGDYRVVFELDKRAVTIWVVMNRKAVYEEAGGRYGRR